MMIFLEFLISLFSDVWLFFPPSILLESFDLAYKTIFQDNALIHAKLYFFLLER